MAASSESSAHYWQTVPVYRDDGTSFLVCVETAVAERIRNGDPATVSQIITNYSAANTISTATSDGTTECDEGDGVLSTAAATGNKLTWSHDKILLLVDIYSQFRQRLSDSKYKKKDVWTDVAKSMSSFGSPVTADEANKKWHNMAATYKRIVDSSHKTGRGGKKWCYFDHMAAVIGHSASTRSLSQLQPVVKSSSTRSKPVVPQPAIVGDVMGSQLVRAGDSVESCGTTSQYVPAPIDDLLGPTSDVEPEDILVEKSAAELGAQQRRTRCKRSQPPEWFVEFEKKMSEDRAEARHGMREYMARQDAHQKQRLELMREGNSLLKLIITQQSKEQ